jgi:SAM-dependent methyltransferase
MCPLCHKNNTSPYLYISRNEKKFQTRICNYCSFIYQDPAPNAEEILEFYSKDYFNGKSDYHYKDEREKIKYENYVFDARLKVIQRYQSSGNFLDIGCSFGGLLDRAKENFKTFGVEISPYPAKIARKKGHTIINGPFIALSGMSPFAEKIYENYFSVITLIEVIEHLQDIYSVFQEIYRILKPGGIAVIQTANLSGFQAKLTGKDYHYFLPGHTSYFNIKTFRYIRSVFHFSKYKIYFPVEFGLLPKLQKSRGDFKKLSDYFRWLQIIYYHLSGKIHIGDFALQSSMVVYLQK